MMRALILAALLATAGCSPRPMDIPLSIETDLDILSEEARSRIELLGNDGERLERALEVLASEALHDDTSLLSGADFVGEVQRRLRASERRLAEQLSGSTPREIINAANAALPQYKERQREINLQTIDRAQQRLRQITDERAARTRTEEILGKFTVQIHSVTPAHLPPRQYTQVPLTFNATITNNNDFAAKHVVFRAVAQVRGRPMPNADNEVHAFLQRHGGISPGESIRLDIRADEPSWSLLTVEQIRNSEITLSPIRISGVDDSIYRLPSERILPDFRMSEEDAQKELDRATESLRKLETLIEI